VTDSAGQPVSYAYVFDRTDGSHTVTGHDGRFRIVIANTNASTIIGVRRIGYQPVDVPVVPGTANTNQLIVVMPRIAVALDTVRVRAVSGQYDEYLDRTGYYRRSAKSPDGSFITAAQIERRNATEITAVLRDVNGVRVISRTGRGGKMSFPVGRGGLCALGLVIDGQRVKINSPSTESLQPRITSIMGGRPVAAIQNDSGPESLDEMVPPSMVAAMEVYPSAASVPNELQHHVRGCGLVVVWTRYQ
jgi:hypothetical protein